MGMGMSILDNGKMIVPTVKEYIYQIVEPSMKDYGKMISKKVREKSNG